MLLKKRLVYTIDRFFSYPERGVYEHISRKNVRNIEMPSKSW